MKRMDTGYRTDREAPEAWEAPVKRPEKNSGIKSPSGAPETLGREERESGGRGKGWKIAAWAGGFLALALVMAGGAYAYLAQQYKDTFFPNTTINGMDASGKTVDEVKKLIEIGMPCGT